MDKSSIGRAGFAERAGVDDADRRAAVESVLDKAKADGIEIIRLSFVDQHGILRGKTLPANQLASAMQNGCTMTSSLLLKDTAHKTVFPVWTSSEILGTSELVGAGDIVMLPDPATYRRLPWSAQTGWLLCDIFLPSGLPLGISTRAILRDSVTRLAASGFSLTAGIEAEFHVFKLEDDHLQPARSGQPADPPSVSLTAHGYQYLTESIADEVEPVTELVRKAVQALGLPLRSIEVEFGPSQYEVTFEPLEPMALADAMVLFRSSVKQVCRRHGYHATFMCRPAFPNLFSSGWHLHQSLTHVDSGENVFSPSGAGELLSDTGLRYVAGLLAHAAESMVLTTPTVNGYKRYQPMTMAPDRLGWSRDNKGALLRTIGGMGDPGTRIENRVGEPAANPYLYLASQIESGLDGIERELTPPPPTVTPYGADGQKLPASLSDAVQHFRQSDLFKASFGDIFVEYLSTIKAAEFARFMAAVTDWEQREYFRNF